MLTLLFKDLKSRVLRQSFNIGLSREPGGPGAVGAVDLSVHGQVVVAEIYNILKSNSFLQFINIFSIISYLQNIFLIRFFKYKVLGGLVITYYPGVKIRSWASGRMGVRGSAALFFGLSNIWDSSLENSWKFCNNLNFFKMWQITYISFIKNSYIDKIMTFKSFLEENKLSYLLQVREVVGQRLHNGWMDRAVDALIRRAQILGT